MHYSMKYTCSDPCRSTCSPFSREPRKPAALSFVRCADTRSALRIFRAFSFYTLISRNKYYCLKFTQFASQSLLLYYYTFTKLIISFNTISHVRTEISKAQKLKSTEASKKNIRAYVMYTRLDVLTNCKYKIKCQCKLTFARSWSQSLWRRKDVELQKLSHNVLWLKFMVCRLKETLTYSRSLGISYR